MSVSPALFLWYQLSSTPLSVEVRLMPTPCGYQVFLASSPAKHHAPSRTLASIASTASLPAGQPLFQRSSRLPSATTVDIWAWLMPCVPSATRSSISASAAWSVGRQVSLKEALMVAVSPG
jgi:hypothetical protein